MNASARNSKADRLADYLEDALQLRRRLKGWEDDSRFVSDGGKIIYSVDTDVVMLYVDPAERASPVLRKDGRVQREGYTQIFRHDAQFTALALADAVCQAIFFSPGRGNSTRRALATVMVPPLDEEFTELFQALMSEARDNGQAELERLDSDDALVAKLASRQISVEARYDLLREQLPEIATFLLEGRGPHEKLRRLHHFARETRLVHFERFVETSLANTPELKALGERQNSDLWLFGRVAQHVSQRLPTEGINHERDAKALGRLAVLNSKLEPQKIRFVHITGATSLFSAADALSCDLRWDAEPLKQENEPSFADRYLRHPTSFLAAPTVPFPSVSSAPEEGGLIEWLDVFLTKLDVPVQRRLAGNLISRAALLQLAQRALERDPVALDAFEQRWKDFVSPMVMTRLAEDERRQTDVRKALTDLRQRIRTDFEDTWRRCLETVAATGYNFTGGRGGETGPPRDVPLVWFDCETAAEKAMADVQAALGARDEDGGPDYQKSIEELRSLDPNGYFYFVGFGVLFAAANGWRATQILAEHAMQIVSKAAKAGARSGDITGREAFYLACVARRNTASGADDFELARAHLKSAFRALSRDRAHQSQLPPDRPRPRLSSLRFEAEELALQTAGYLFGRFTPGVAGLDIQLWADFWTSMEGLLNRLPEEEDERIRRSLERRMLINLLSRYLHDETWRDSVSRDEKLGARLAARLDQLDRSMDQEPRPPVSYLHHAVWTAAALVIPRHAQARRRELKRKAEALFTPEKIERNSVTQYDRARFEELRDLCIEA